MKSINDSKSKQKNPTTNYAPDKHKEFCKRCFSHNGKCPNTGKVSHDPNCKL